MRRNVLIEKCRAGEISGEKYEELCRHYPWLKQNVEARGKPEHEEIKTIRRHKRQGDK